MKYFILDLYDNPGEAVANCVDALRLATRKEQAKIIQFRHDEFMNCFHEEGYAEQIVDQLKNADIIIAFTDQNLLMYMHNIASFREVLYQKIDNRTPFFFQFMDIWETYYAPTCGYPERRNTIVELLEYLEIYPTGIRVYNSDQSEYYTKFTPEFEPVMFAASASNVFEDGINVGIFESNLMTFGEGNSALLKSHHRNHHDSTRDPGAGLPDFERHSSFVIRNTNRHFGYFVCGTFMAIKFHYIAEKTAVPEASRAAISNIIRELQLNVRVTTDA